MDAKHAESGATIKLDEVYDLGRKDALAEVLDLIDKVKPYPIYDDFAEPEFFDGVDAGQSNMRYSIEAAVRELRDATK